MINNLRMYNLVSTEITQEEFQLGGMGSLIPQTYDVTTHRFTQRFYRFMFWIEYYDKIEPKFYFKKVDKIQKDS